MARERERETERQIDLYNMQSLRSGPQGAGTIGFNAEGRGKASSAASRELPQTKAVHR